MGEESLSEIVDEAKVNQDGSDSLSISMEDVVQPAYLSSSLNSFIESTLDRPAFLLEISADKKRIAYVVDISEPNQDKQFYLRIRNITYPSTGPVLCQGVVEENITDCMQCVDDFTYSFLSLSSNGDRVAISFCKFDSLGRPASKKPTCCVFRVHESGIELEKKIDRQGKAMFTPDGHLAIVSKDILNLYNCKENYKYASCLDVGYLSPAYVAMPECTSPGVYQVYWSSSFSGPLKRDEATQKMLVNLQLVLHLTRFLVYNILTPCFEYHTVMYDYDGACVWSLTGGVRSIPFQSKSDAEVQAISHDKTLLATYGESNGYVSIYHIKSGLLVSRMKSKRIMDTSTSFLSVKALYSVHFSKDNTYVFLITIRDEINEGDIYEDDISEANSNETLFAVEVWNRNAEVLMFKYEEEIDVDWHSRNTLMPYIVEPADSPLSFTVVYTTISKNGTFDVRSLNLELFENAAKEDAAVDSWKMHPLIRQKNRRFPKRVYWMSLKSAFDGITYQLRFSKFAVELWRFCQNQDKKVLIYIRAFHPPKYYQGGAFEESWALEVYRRFHYCTNVDSLRSCGILLMRDRIAIDIIQDGNFYQKGISSPKNAQIHTDQIFLPFADLKIAEESCDSSNDPFQFACSDFHYIESVCRGFYYLHQSGSGRQDMNLYQQTKSLIEQSIKKMKQEKSRYFTTISGSNTLAMLASFQDGRDIIFQILQTDDLQINLLTYVRNFAMTDKENEFVVRRENALTILIENFDYELFDLLFNRALLHAQSLGVGAFCAISDTIVFLQERSETVILRNSCEKLKFLKMETSSSKLKKAMDLDVLHNSMNAEFSDYSSFGALEQIPEYNTTIRNAPVLYWLQQRAISMKRKIVKLLKGGRFHKYYHTIMSKSMAHTNLLSVCVVPFIHFSLYTIFWEDVEFKSHHSNRDDNTWTARLNGAFCKLLRLSNTKYRIVHKAESELMQLASNQHENDIFHQKTSVIEVLLYYKWKTFIRRKFYWIYAIHLVYYISFCIGVLFARECFGDVIGASIPSSSRHNVPIALMFVSNFILSAQELRQLLNIGLWRYLTSVYNIVDLAALILPPVCFGLMVTGNSSLDEASAIATIFLWIHGILRLRPFAFIGVTLETMIQLMKSVYKTLIIMLLVIFAFTHAFIVLLLHKDDSYFQEQYSGPVNLTDTESTVSYSDTSASNSFTNVFKAFSTLWLFIYGVWDPITDGDAGDDFMIIVFAMLFSFVTVLLFFNLVIALMSSKAEEVKALGKSIWLSHFAEVIAEIEQFWCTRSERTNRNNSPSVVYYIAKYTDVRQQAEILEKECDSLIKELQNKLEKRQRAVRPDDSYFMS